MSSISHGMLAGMPAAIVAFHSELFVLSIFAVSLRRTSFTSLLSCLTVTESPASDTTM